MAHNIRFSPDLDGKGLELALNKAEALGLEFESIDIDGTGTIGVFTPAAAPLPMLRIEPDPSGASVPRPGETRVGRGAAYLRSAPVVVSIYRAPVVRVRPAEPQPPAPEPKEAAPEPKEAAPEPKEAAPKKPEDDER